MPAFRQDRTHGCVQRFHSSPVIALTFLCKVDGKLWFTLLPEIGHVLLHPNHELMVQADGGVLSPNEIEANEFASETLIPAGLKDQLNTLRYDGDVVAFAHTVGVSPGIVVGQLHHMGIWERRRGQRLFKRFGFNNN